MFSEILACLMCFNPVSLVLFWCSNCPIISQWELLQVDSCFFLTDPTFPSFWHKEISPVYLVSLLPEFWSQPAGHSIYRPQSRLWGVYCHWIDSVSRSLLTQYWEIYFSLPEKYIPIIYQIHIRLQHFTYLLCFYSSTFFPLILKNPRFW